MLGQAPCAGVDQGDGFDCYGVPVSPNDPRTRRLTGVEIADVWRRLQLVPPQRYTFEEQAHIRAGTFGANGLALWTSQTGGTGVQAMPTVDVVGLMRSNFWPLLGLAAVIWWATRPHARRGET